MYKKRPESGIALFLTIILGIGYLSKKYYRIKSFPGFNR
jgi:hypothetical protein